MKKQKKILAQIIVFVTILLSSCQVFATDVQVKLMDTEISESFKQWFEVNNGNGDITTTPRIYEIPKNKLSISNPLRAARLLRSTLSSKYSLTDDISENVVIKDQQQTASCWTFASLAALETNLALSDKINQRPTMVYDFAERHMEYATSMTFTDGTNPIGFNRNVNDGGKSDLFIPYLTNGTGAIAESEMPFENNANKIALSEIQNKKVISQVDDIVTFPSYSSTDDKTQIIQQMKEHIKNNGAIYTGLHGVGPFNSSCYNAETAACYCNHDEIPSDEGHAVAIVGWDDEFSKENFATQPTNNGAWIIKNSWGTGEKYTVAQMKQIIFNSLNNDDKTDNDITSIDQITTDTAIEIFKELGYTIEGTGEDAIAVLNIGDNGFMYVSYDDYHIYSELVGIENAQSGVLYDNIYQYDQYGATAAVTVSGTKAYLANIFDKKTSGTEYLDKVSIMATEKYTCKVYVNPNGTDKAKGSLQQVQLKTGETETFEAGYHTIEFAEPVKITGENFVVVLEVQGYESDSISVGVEFNFEENIDWFVNSMNQGITNEEERYTKEDFENITLHLYDNVTVESGKTFFTTEAGFDANIWDDTAQFNTTSNGAFPNFNTTLKAFTVSNILESIEVTTPPTKTKYTVGEDFDKTGMVVKAKYANGTSEEITDYTISNGTDLQVGQTSVTISYKEKTATQAIEVKENTLQSIAITTPPTKTEYFAGEDFDKTGMIVEATYTDGTIEEVTDYTITDGKTLKNGQTTVTISYEDKTATQAITVKANPVTQIEIKQGPTFTEYVVGQNFDPTGMIVEATYQNGMVKEVEDYTIQDGTDLKLDQTTVTIEYEGQTAIVEITVIEKDVLSISVKTNPTKTQYIQNKENLDLTGGVIEILYNDNSKQDMAMTSEEITVSGFDNKELGKKTITLKYEGKTAQFDVEIVAEEKPENSNFDGMNGSVKRIRVYTFTDTNKEGYTVINVALNNIVKATENDKMEYYYYLSANPKAENIVDWVKINELQETENGLSFEINTSDISNYEEVSASEALYLYVKEVATRNNMQQEAITSAVELKTEDVNIEEYLDGEKVAEVEPGTITGTDSTAGDKEDNTTAEGTIPNAGKSLFMICLAFAVVIIGRIAYLRYKDIQIK